MRRIVGAGLVVMLMAACGGDQKSSTTAAPTSTTLSQAQLDDQKAQGIVLTTADVPGYTVETPDPDEANLLPEACFNGNALLLRIGRDDDPRGALSQNFTDSKDASVGSAVTFAETVEEASAAMAILNAPSFPTCFAADFAKELRKQPEFTNVTATTTRLPALAVGDQSVGYRTTVKSRYTGTALTTYFDFVFVRSGRGFAVVDAVASVAGSSGTAFPNAERIRLVTAVANRLAA